MKKIITVLALALSASFSSFAQDAFNVGVKAGVALNMMPGTVLDAGDRFKPNIGFYAGAVARYDVSDLCFLQAELEYARKGVSTNSDIQGKYSRNIHYIQLPVFIGMTTYGDRFRVMIGPEFGVCIGSQMVYDSVGEHPASNGNVVAPFQLCAAVQTNYYVSDNFTVDFKFDLGLTRTFKKDGYYTEDKGRHSGLSIGVSYFFL